MQEFARRARHTLFYIYNNFVSFFPNVLERNSIMQSTFACLIFQFNRTNTLNVIKIGDVVFFH